MQATSGKLFCVDLAGSERAKKSGARGSRMDELKVTADQRGRRDRNGGPLRT